MPLLKVMGLNIYFQAGVVSADRIKSAVGKGVERRAPIRGIGVGELKKQ